MGKNKKKRNKAYSGPDAADARPVIIKIAASNRSKLGQWIFEKKAILKPALIAVIIIAVIAVIVIEIVRALN